MVSKELENAAKSYAIEMYRTTRNELLAEKCKWAFISGARFEQRQKVVPNKEQDEPTASDRGMAGEIIIHLKRVEEDYRLNLTNEIQWLRNKEKKGK